MRHCHSPLFWLLASSFWLLLLQRPSSAYIEAAYSLGQVVNESSNIVLMKVVSVDRDKNTIIFTKVEDIKGKHPRDEIKHNIARAGFDPREWQNIMAWAAEGKIAVMCHNGSASETCIDNYWYQTYPGKDGANSEWWNMYHGEPYLLRSFAGKPEKFAAAAKAMLAGEEVIVSCMVDGDKNALALRMARVQKMRASLNLHDYNPARDFAGWGGDEIRPILDMPAFGQMSMLPTLPSGGGVGGGSSGWGIATGHMESANRTDIVLFNEDRVAVLKNEGEGSFDTVELKPPISGARDAAWSDYNGMKRDSLLLATPQGPKLLTNMGAGVLRDDSAALPTWGYTSLTAAAWLNVPRSSDPALRGGRGNAPAILLADQFAGLRLLANETPPPNDKGELPAAKFKDISDAAGVGAAGIASNAKISDLIACDLLATGEPQVLVNTANGRLFLLAFRNGKLEEIKLTGLSLQSPAQLAVADLTGDGKPDVIAVSSSGTRFFKNLGNGKFENITQNSGLTGTDGTSIALVPSAPSPHQKIAPPDLIIGSTRSTNRYFRNDGRGHFKETSTDIGMTRRIFNTRALAVLPTTSTGNADIVLVNEGQPSCVLLWKK